MRTEVQTPEEAGDIPWRSSPFSLGNHKQTNHQRKWSNYRERLRLARIAFDSHWQVKNMLTVRRVMQYLPDYRRLNWYERFVMWLDSLILKMRKQAGYAS